MADIEFLDLSEAEQYTVFYEASHNNNYAAYVRGRRCVDDESLFKEFSAAFQFPYYFGMNVAAFDECMTDLSWLSFEGIFLLIDHFGDVYKGRKADQNWLCDILKQFQREWNARGVKMRVIICGQYVLTAVNGNPIIYEGQTYNESTGEIEGAATGNPTSYPVNGTSYDLTWQNGRQLSSFSKVNTALPSGRWTVSYKYDTDGIRTEKRVPRGNRGLYTVYTYITQNGKIMRQSDNRGIAAQVLDFVYDESGKPFALNYSTNNGSSFTTYYYILNLQGDVVGLTDASGTFVAQYTYNAWGEVLTATGNMAGINPLRYRGYYYDSETGFYYLQSRYYDPANHRFINADSYASTGQGCIGTNMFAYCLNNPVTATDPTGYDSTTDSNGNGIADYLEIRWFVQTEKAKIQLASKNGALRDVTEEVDKALKYACFIGDAYRALIESGGPIFRAEMSVYALKKFYTMVNHEAEWDIKRKAQWESTIGTTFPGYDTVVLYHNQAMTPEMIGNYTYGVIGEAFGFPIDTLLAGSFVAAGFPTEGAELINEYTDWNYIRRGYYHISLDGAY